MSIEYSLYAKYYDQIHCEKDYQSEAKRVKELVKEFKKSSGNKLLDLACGTGEHIKFLKDEFDIIGIDKSMDMLKIAMKKNPDCKFLQANLQDLELEEKFDVINCLFNSIGYLENEKELEKTIKNF